ncbi:hypothetical protein [Thiobacillus sedimenti]|uniref:Transmembrane protein n=1 Tax=Thiobacillus sedimenti TaxID=3110231 RepID=A0ABZ1CHJ4_9PROT|nr:hypothetical protein [Thiobacillus sp. SCUT-2]WRS38455.1 hypothetical protein VA613_10615 [Thiobacillus sp. SCUT-2]
MERHPHLIGLAHTVRHILGHVGVTLLAVGIAFSLPMLAKYILFTWWPMVEDDSQLLLINEIIFAAVLVLLFNFFLSARQGRLSQRMNQLASLIHVREGGAHGHRSDRQLIERITGARDVSVLSITGYDTFVADQRKLHDVIDQCYELRVMLMNPYGPGAMRRMQSFGDPASLLERHAEETAAAIARLSRLAAAGKQVMLKFYDEPPFWSLIVTGEHVWVQYCHDGQRLDAQPEYVFALDKERPTHGLFSAFYVHFLNQWSARHPEYDFATRELVYRDHHGNEARRVPFPPSSAEYEAPRLAMAG